jgi:hypothetical protein
MQEVKVCSWNPIKFWMFHHELEFTYWKDTCDAVEDYFFIHMEWMFSQVLNLEIEFSS